MIRKLYSAINKNIKVLARSKFSLAAIIIVPFLVILLAGFAFNSSGLSGVNVGVYSEAYSDLSEDILTGLGENFTIVKFNSSQECVDSVKSSDSQICMIFPADLSEQGSTEEIVFHVDHSRINLAYTLIHEIKLKITAKASDLGISLAQDIINGLNSIKGSLPEQKSQISLSKNNLEDIKGRSKINLSLSDVENASYYLNSAYNLANSSTLKADLTKAIAALSLLNDTLLNASNTFTYIGTQNNVTILILDSILVSLEGSISKVRQTNVVEAESIVSPIKTRIEPISGDSTNKDYLIPTIISLIALFGGILLSSTFVLQERKSKAYFRKFLTPTGDFTFLLANYLTCLIILILQFALVLIGVQFILEMNLAGILPEIALILFVSFSAFIFIGMFFGYLFKSEETTIFAGVLISALLMFFSNVLLPIESISNNLKSAALFNPLVLCDSALKKVTLFGLDLSFIANELYFLAGFVVVFAALSYLGRKITKRML